MKRLNNLIVHPPNLIGSFLRNVIWRVNTEKKILYLTFDDGPVPKLTENLLDILDKYKAKASFFCVGENVSKYPEIYKEIINRKHLSGNHTYSHLNGWKTSGKIYLDNIRKAEKVISSDFFRPPYGKLNPYVSSKITKLYKVVMWDVLSMDFDNRISPQKCFENVKHFAKKGSVIVFHDNYKAQKNMLYGLEKTLDFYGSAGYVFKTLPV